MTTGTLLPNTDCVKGSRPGAAAGIAGAFGTLFQRETAAPVLDDNVEPVEDEH